MPVNYQSGRVARIVFDRPDRHNALDPASWDQLDQALIDFARDTSGKVLILSGSGGSFCSGADLGSRLDGSEIGPFLEGLAALVLRLHDMPKPVVALVDGIAAGAGMSLALACDLVLASERARFAASFSRLGLVPDCGLTWLLPRAVGPYRAKELALSGRAVESVEALAIGLVNAVVPVASLESVSAEWCDRLIEGRQPATGATLELLDAAWVTTLADALAAETSAQLSAVEARRA